jgi:predicted Zn-dependent protease with MMP-like domain
MAARYTISPDIDAIEALAHAALETIPKELRVKVAGVVFRVHDFPDDATCREMELVSPFDILGLYRGVPFGEKSVSDAPHDVDMIFLYRRPLLDYWCESGEDLEHLIRHVLIHEIGHHFGLSDADMDRIEAQVEA